MIVVAATVRAIIDAFVIAVVTLFGDVFHVGVDDALLLLLLLLLL